MRTRALLHLAGWIVAFGCLVPALAETVYLDATFDDKAIDEPIGSGGAAVGEPINVGTAVSAIVRSAPFATPSLEIKDEATQAGGDVVFEFLGGAEVTSGLLVIEMDLWFSELSGENQQIELQIREHGGSEWQFLNMYFWGDGRINIASEADAAWLGPYVTGRAFPIVIVINLDARRLSLWLDGEPAVSDFVCDDGGLGVPGVGRVQLGALYDEDLLPSVWVDRIRVSDTPPDTPAESTTWGAVKALFRP